MSPGPKTDFSADHFLRQLGAKKSTQNIPGIQRFMQDDMPRTNKILGVRMGDIFKLARGFQTMPIKEIRKLIRSPYFEARMGAVSIMDFQARDRKFTDEHRKALFELYIKNHDKINNWDLVDRAAPHVVGGYLFDKPRKKLSELARSRKSCERRTAIVSTYFFIKNGEVKETFKIARLLLSDEHELVQKATGSWLREAGKKEPEALREFLDKHHKKMSRTTLRIATEKLNKSTRDRYLKTPAKA